jgi:dTDP-D-glucose 4,6-dehydratase
MVSCTACRCIAKGVAGQLGACNSKALCRTSQVVVLDKLDYCASLHNLDSVKDCPNFKVRHTAYGQGLP